MTIYYEDERQDVVASSNQDYQLPSDFEWKKNKFWQKAFRFFLIGLGKTCAWVYRRKLHVSYANETTEDPNRFKGYFAYSNHTQEEGDAFFPFHDVRGKKLTILVAPANLSVPVFGRMIPYSGALVVPKSIGQMQKFNAELDQRIADGDAIFIYPEEHVWPYYTKIRPMNRTSFHFPATTDLPVFCFTTTYQKRKHSKKPKTTIYIDGPFLAPKEWKIKEKQKYYYQQIESCMKRRAELSTYQYM